jgi:CIC family chloride channel protein
MYNFINRDKVEDIKHHTTLLLLAILIGAISGVGAYLVKLLIHYSKIIFWGKPILFLHVLETHPWWQILLVPAIGGLIVGPIIYFGAREAKGHGVPEVMEAVFLKGGRIRPIVAFVKAIASSITIASGGPVGREGPIVQIGSGLASTIGQFFKLKEKDLKTLVGAGAAAGIAAAFNAPIAGALFSAEIILGNFAISSFAPIIVSSVIGNMVLIAIEGSEKVFKVPVYTMNSPWEIAIYFALGIIAGFVGVIFIKFLYFSEEKWNGLKISEPVKPLIGGLIIGLVALKFPHILGTGYETIDLALQENIFIIMALILIFVKIFVTSTSLSSGSSGGIFAPSLFMGAQTGYFVGKMSSILFPSLHLSVGAYALVGMGGVVAGAIQAPLTAIIIIFELTGDYKVILPLMITCIIASLISEIFNEYSIYTLKLKLKGIVLREGVEVNVLKKFKVKDVISSDYIKVERDTSIKRLMEIAINGKHNVYNVVNEKGDYLGIITLEHLKIIMGEKDSFEDLILAIDVVDLFEPIKEDDNLETAMNMFGKYDLDEIPVVRDSKIIGVIRRKDIIETYNKEISKREATSTLLSKLRFSKDKEIVELSPGYYIKEIEAPIFTWGESLKNLQLRNRFGIDIILIRKKNPPQTIPLPGGEQIITKGDTIIIAGKNEFLEKFENKKDKF